MKRIVANMNKDQLQEAIIGLPILTAQIISLYYVEHITQKEICTKLNIPISRTRSQLARGRIMLMILTNCEEHRKAQSILYPK